MTTWIALFRAVNLGPTNRLPMSDLRAILEALGYESVRTHLQSGNALFATTGATAKDLERVIRARVEREAGLTVPVLVRSTKELDAVVAANPFVRRRTPPKQLHVAFLSAPAPRARVTALDPASYAPDELEIGKKVLYLRLPNGVQGKKLPDVDKALGVSSTLRTWRTVTRLAELAHD